jgi:hypothetical protein
MNRDWFRKKRNYRQMYPHRFNAGAGFDDRAGGGGYLHRRPFLALKAGRICWQNPASSRGHKAMM